MRDLIGHTRWNIINGININNKCIRLFTGALAVPASDHVVLARQQREGHRGGVQTARSPRAPVADAAPQPHVPGPVVPKRGDVPLVAARPEAGQPGGVALGTGLAKVAARQGAAGAVGGRVPRGLWRLLGETAASRTVDRGNGCRRVGRHVVGPSDETRPADVMTCDSNGRR